MGEERIKSEAEVNAEEKPLSNEELDRIAGGAMEEGAKGNKESEEKIT